MVTAVVAGIVAVVAAVGGIQLKDPAPGGVKLDPTKVSAWPVGLRVLALVAGSCLGIIARTHDWFSPTLTETIDHWTASGLDRKLVTNRLFDSRYPKTSSGPSIDRSVLFSAEAQNECGTLKVAPDVDLRRQMLGSTLPGVAAFAAKIQDPAVLRAALETLIPCE